LHSTTSLLRIKVYGLRDRRAKEESREKRRSRKEGANRSSDASDLSVLDVPSSKKFEINFAI
jgi:hypothetical protein